MQIVSFIQDSFTEFEGEHSITLFCKGCNLRCPECYNLDEVLHGDSQGSAIEILKKKLTPIHSGVVFLGGEPTIWEDDLISALQWVQSKGLKTKVFSNGIKHNVISKINKAKIVDAWSIDVKCIHSANNVLGKDIKTQNYLKNIKRSINNIIESNTDIELRTTLWDSVKDQKENIEFFIKNTFPNVKHIWQQKFQNNKVDEFRK